MKKSLSILAIALMATFGATSSFAQTSSTFNPATGTGFAAKGDVQRVLGLNNAGYQSTSYTFSYMGEVVTEVTWECTNDNNEKVQERARTTTSSVSGVVAALARVKNQITGHNLTGYSGTVSNSLQTEGPAVNSCPGGDNPNSGSPWYLSTPAGEPEVISSTGGLFVNGVLLPTLQ